MCVCVPMCVCVCVCVWCVCVCVCVCSHLDGAVLENLSRPHVLVTDAYTALHVQARRKERDQALLSELSNLA